LSYDLKGFIAELCEKFLLSCDFNRWPGHFRDPNSPVSSWEIGQKYSFGIASFEDGAWEFPVGLGKLPREALLLLDLLQG